MSKDTFLSFSDSQSSVLPVVTISLVFSHLPFVLELYSIPFNRYRTEEIQGERKLQLLMELQQLHTSETRELHSKITLTHDKWKKRYHICIKKKK